MKTPLRRHISSFSMAPRAATLATLCLGLLLTISTATIAAAQEGDLETNVETTNVAAADTQAPTEVKNVKATTEGTKVKLTWNAATDDVGVKGYKVYYGTTSVTNDGATYESGPEDAGDNLSFEKELEEGTYYFAVTAYDEAGNESANYSVEVSATVDSLHAAADGEAPQVAKAEARSKTTVAVTFSEAVVLPATNPASAFSVKEDGTQAVLEVTNAVLDPQDTTNKTVLLTTAEQKVGVNYIVTAGIQVKDSEGNPVESGTSDTAVFTGSDKEVTATNTTDVTAPELSKVVVLDNTHVEITFSEPVVLATNPTQNFIITEVENIERTLDVTEAKLSADATKVTITTAPQQQMKYNLIVLDVADKAGNMISIDKNATVFTGAKVTDTTPPTGDDTTKPTDTPTDTAKDTTPPEDVTNFVGKSIKKMVATLQWKASVNTAGDLKEYVLYQSKDGVNYDKGIVLKADATMYDVLGLTPGMKYFFKLTAKDTAGNESKGAVTTFMLPETGPGLALLLLGSVGAGKFLTRKKKSKK